ncbi:SURF1 family protein [Mesorhizobium australicum]|uniref:SURF1-like protein n=1 Tax=Mesorhizobium australicum TaxID=536018 RepID=A0A1X7N3U7_9HYPH|nr:SURF1 family protein [Mesorhizobium australicum]SMH31519.1 surfeit locus 1 family protein [Mesorhizobium australicum]
MTARPPASVLLITAAALVCAALLCALGVWQVQRLQWKLDLIARVDARVSAAPVAPPGSAAWDRVDAASAEYLRVRATGRFLHDRETLVQAVTDLGSGYWVMTPVVTDQGFTILVNRGFVTPELRDPETRSEGAAGSETTVTGLLRLSEPGGGFLRDNDPGNGRWYSRDVAAIAAAQRLDHTAPYFIDADATPNPGGWPVGGLTRISFSNNHLVYAITWFGLALMALAGGWFVLKDWRRRESGKPMEPPGGMVSEPGSAP